MNNPGSDRLNWGGSIARSLVFGSAITVGVFALGLSPIDRAWLDLFFSPGGYVGDLLFGPLNPHGLVSLLAVLVTNAIAYALLWFLPTLVLSIMRTRRHDSR